MVNSYGVPMFSVNTILNADTLECRPRSDTIKRTQSVADMTKDKWRFGRSR